MKRKGVRFSLTITRVMTSVLLSLLLLSVMMFPKVVFAAPNAPTALTAVAFSPTQVNLTWTDNSADEDGFKIERAVNAGFTQDVNLMTAGVNVQTYSDTTVESGITYYFRVKAYNGTGDSAPTDTATITMPLVPQAPTDLTGVITNARRVDLSWADNSTDETGFKIERALNDTFTQDFNQVTVGVDVETYTDNDVEPNTTYYYRVFAYNATGNSGLSDTLMVTTPPVPGAPTVLAANLVSNTQINLTWTDNSDSEDGFRVERAENEDFDVNLVTVIPPANSTGYENNTIGTGKTYHYRVFAYDSNGLSDSSNVVEIEVDVPDAPSGLTAVANSGNQVRLNWTNNASNQTGFRIERARNASFTTAPTSFTVGGAVNAYNDNTVLPLTTYYYRVFAVNVIGESAASNIANVTTPDVPPAAPSSLTASAVSTTQVNLSWVNNAVNPTGFRVKRATDTNFTVGLASFIINTPTATTHSDNSAAPATTYYYRVFAMNAIGDSLASNTATVTTTGGGPNAPTNLTAHKVNNNRVDLTWTDNSNNETAFNIETATNSAFTGSITLQIGANVASYSDTSVYAGDTFYYRVMARNSAGTSAPTNVASVNIPAPVAGVPNAPSNLVAVLNGNQVDLTWADNSSDETGFQLERSSDSGFLGSFVSVIVAMDATSYSDTTVSTGTYYYRAKAYNALGSSTESNAVTVTIGSSGSGTGGGTGGGGTGGSSATIPPPVVTPPPPVNVEVIGLSGTLQVGGDGKVGNLTEIQSTDKYCVLRVLEGTSFLDISGNIVHILTYAKANNPPLAPQGKVILSAHNFGPDGLQFNPPICLVIKYEPAMLVTGMKEKELTLAWWDGIAWRTLPSTVDTVAHSVTANVAHFTNFALLANRITEVQPPVTPTVTPVTNLPTTTPTSSIPLQPVQTTPATQPSVTPNPASFNWWLIPAIAGGVIAGISIAFIISNNRKSENKIR